MATLIRTEHISLGAYLTKRRVLGARLECTYRYRTQTEVRERLFREAGTSNWKDLARSRRGLTAAA
ncbi:hypothetical protein M433DRAFT_158833, partial [Acidomyces richmondensis BFW]